MTRAAMWLSGVLAFFKKDLVSIIRQPRLVLTLVLGPFVILALFGVGYKQQIDPLRAVFVVTDDGEYVDELEARAEEFSEDFRFVGRVDNEAAARAALRSGRADVAIVVPPDPAGTILEGERAVFTVLHDRLDPFEQATISLLARSTVNGLNERVLNELVAAGQQEADDIEALLPATRQSLTAMRAAMEAGNRPEAIRRRAELVAAIEELQAQTVAADAVVDSVDGADGEASVSGDLATLRQRALDLDLDGADGSLDDELAAIGEMEREVAALESAMSDFRRIPAEVLVRPFGADTDVVAAVDLQVVDFYAPGVIALLLQHLGIVFGGLSLVRERARGTTEVFRVAPLQPLQILLGKYAAYLVASAVVAAALGLLMLYVFGIPLVGSVGSFIAVIVLLSLASLGIGFVLSSLVQTDMQAVNGALIILLLGTFFSGFFLSLDRLTPPVRVVSWALPITHAIDSLRDVMFRGVGVDLRTWVALGGGSVLLFLVALALLHRGLRTD